ncbi:UDP-N-acetylmuramate--alanine ligase [Amylibacter kogurei]|uniref:UDP-N-acetylmuramate--alanine ligase n=1 Tax=Paramylibacter kogurei TaxID=1889778 RepID=A0A2G5K3U8_9RHOB|nr:DUF2484 family protein [Amylibacter kogurei]PIB24217.1 UDP-N-acetylmuramate--alanine ligase [Amylibacter kogurei]
MAWSLILAAIWVICSTIVAMFPMRWQMKPGLLLLVAAPILIIWIGYDYGWWISLAGFCAFASMFSNPLRYFYRRARGLETETLP